MISQFFGLEIIKPITKLTSTTFQLESGSLLRVGGRGLSPQSNLICDTAVSGIGGLDTGAIAANTLYYIYAVISGSNYGLVISVSPPSVGPTGFTLSGAIGVVIADDLSGLTDPGKKGDKLKQEEQWSEMHTSAPSIDTAIPHYQTQDFKKGSHLFLMESDTSYGTRATTIVACIMDMSAGGIYTGTAGLGIAYNPSVAEKASNISALPPAKKRSIHTHVPSQYMQAESIDNIMAAGDVLCPMDTQFTRHSSKYNVTCRASATVLVDELLDA